VSDLAFLLHRADRLLAAILTGRVGADAARELAEVLAEIEAVARSVGPPP
jgi:hypothetical protein